MRKVQISDIFKVGADWKPPVIDLSDPKVIELIARTKKAQAESLMRKKVDVNRLRDTINI
jgi:hypothetical protein